VVRNRPAARLGICVSCAPARGPRVLRTELRPPPPPPPRARGGPGPPPAPPRAPPPPDPQGAEGGGVKHVAAFIQELAEVMPKEVCSNMALLLPHLGGEAYTIRSAIVSAMASVLIGIERDKRERAAEGVDALPTSTQANNRTRTVQVRGRGACTRRDPRAPPAAAPSPPPPRGGAAPPSPGAPP